MNKNEDIPRIESGEKINIDLDFENVAVKKRRRYPFFLFLLFVLFLLAAVFSFELFGKKDGQESEVIIDSQNTGAMVWQGAFDSKESFDMCRASFVSVIAEGKRCSGFVYSEDGWIVTVEGIVNDSVIGQIEVVFCDGRRFFVDAFKQNRESGLTLLKINATKLSAVRFDISNELCVGEEIFSFCAFDTSGECSLFSGKVAHTDRAVDILRADGGTRKVSLLQISILLAEEGVGAPIFNSRGELVAIACAKGNADGERYMVDYAFSMRDVNRLLSAMKSGKSVGDVELFSVIIE